MRLWVQSPASPQEKGRDGAGVWSTQPAPDSHDLISYSIHTYIYEYIYYCYYYFWWDLGLNSGLPVYKADTLLLELHLRSIFLWLFWSWGSQELFARAGLKL
jgi:hypothetical protein